MVDDRPQKGVDWPSQYNAISISFMASNLSRKAFVGADQEPDQANARVTTTDRSFDRPVPSSAGLSELGRGLQAGGAERQLF